jgi:hypothetical protein
VDRERVAVAVDAVIGSDPWRGNRQNQERGEQ